MKSPNHGVKTLVIGPRPFDTFIGYPVYCPEHFGKQVAGHILCRDTESPVVRFFTFDRIVWVD